MPSSMGSNLYESTPRSKLRPADCSRGEDVLRNQVTNLLKKVESTAAAKSPLLSDLQHDPEAFESPMRLAAPTPANTPATGSWPSAQEAVTVTLPERPCSSLRPTPSPIAIASPVCHLEVCLPLEKCNSYEAYVVSPFKIQDVCISSPFLQQSLFTLNLSIWSTLQCCSWLRIKLVFRLNQSRHQQTKTTTKTAPKRCKQRRALYSLIHPRGKLKSSRLVTNVHALGSSTLPRGSPWSRGRFRLPVLRWTRKMTVDGPS